jgi:hypothetical protein
VRASIGPRLHVEASGDARPWERIAASGAKLTRDLESALLVGPDCWLVLLEHFEREPLHAALTKPREGMIEHASCQPLAAERRDDACSSVVGRHRAAPRIYTDESESHDAAAIVDADRHAVVDGVLLQAQEKPFLRQSRRAHRVISEGFGERGMDRGLVYSP